jgi:hypothetical protein
MSSKNMVSSIGNRRSDYLEGERNKANGRFSKCRCGSHSIKSLEVRNKARKLYLGLLVKPKYGVKEEGK